MTLLVLRSRKALCSSGSQWVLSNSRAGHLLLDRTLQLTFIPALCSVSCCLLTPCAFCRAFVEEMVLLLVMEVNVARKATPAVKMPS